MTFREYAGAVRLHEMAVIDRAIHCLYWLLKSEFKEEGTPRQIADMIVDAGLPDPNVTRVTELLKSSRRVVKSIKAGSFRLHAATQEELSKAVGYLFAPSTPPPATPSLPVSVPFFTQADVSLGKDMSEVYVLIRCLENSARNFIRSRLENAHGANWWDQVKTRDMERKVQDRIREEQRNKWHQPRGSHPLNYLDFGDLKDLICNSWAYFKDAFPDQLWVASRLTELEKSRNVIAHNNILADTEIGRIRLYFGDWCRQLAGIL
jgi:hypothetical protein